VHAHDGGVVDIPFPRSVMNLLAPRELRLERGRLSAPPEFLEKEPWSRAGSRPLRQRVQTRKLIDCGSRRSFAEHQLIGMAVTGSNDI
jgi:hypothetical protein